jgi:hypothetical protein
MADLLTGVMLSTVPMGAQSSVTGQLAELVALKDKVGNADTRVRVDALHRVWSVALASGDPELKVTAIGLLTDPVGSSSDHIRMPAVYAIADIANSTDDPRVKVRALGALAEPLQASQVPIRAVAIDAVNSITRRGQTGEVTLAAVRVAAANRLGQQRRTHSRHQYAGSRRRGQRTCAVSPAQDGAARVEAGTK